MSEDKVITNVGDGDAMLAHQGGDANKVETKAPQNIEDIRTAGRECAKAWVKLHPGRKPSAGNAHLYHVQMFAEATTGDPGYGAFVTAFVDEIKDLPENPQVDFLDADGDSVVRFEVPEYNASQTDDWVVAVGAGHPEAVRAVNLRTGEAWTTNDEGVFEREAPEDA